MTSRLEQLREQEKTKKAELEKTQQELAILEGRERRMTPILKLAAALHSRYCHWNHVDGCDWEYGDIVMNRHWSHNHWIGQATWVLDQVKKYEEAYRRNLFSAH